MLALLTVSTVVLGVAVVALALRMRVHDRHLARALAEADRPAVAPPEPSQAPIGAVALEAIWSELETLQLATADLQGRVEQAPTVGAVSRVGLVRYDAFAEMGGALSFSAALLDDEGSGIVLSTINGRSEARTYAKPIVGTHSADALSDEEVLAIRSAMDGGPLDTLSVPSEVPARRRRRAG